tara:strand:+ start:988 stop:1719 length:732 start_codon:yes stop_codon:yes gene_type:complete
MKTLYLASVMAAALIPSTVMAKEMTRAEVEAIVKEYIQNNPEVILDSVDAYGRAQQEADLEAQQQEVEKQLGWIENNKNLPVAGNPNGDITIVEFFDYNCGYCKKALSDVMTLIEEDKNLKFVFIDMPILGPTSTLAAKWALAAKEQNAYLEYHIALMEGSGMITEARLESIAKKIGLNVDQLRKDAEGPEIAAIVAEKAAKAAQMGISGTPAFIIDGKLYGGYIGVDRMRNAVAEARENKKK